MASFVGIGFGPIQSGLFLCEAFRSGAFDRLVVSEINAETVEKIRENNGCYQVNIAHSDHVQVTSVENVEAFNPTVKEDAIALIHAIGEASEIAVALPSVNLYETGCPSVVDLLAEGIRLKQSGIAFPETVIYTAENNNQAAEILDRALQNRLGETLRIQALNTVIGKMSGIAKSSNLVPWITGEESAFLVEAFNRIYISKILLPDFKRGITAFIEKEDLLPFEEAKLFGHNAIHALLGYTAGEKGCRYISDAVDYPELIRSAREAFLNESGAALIKKHSGVDSLFTAEGFQHYAEDLLERMVNPFLQDDVDRVTRDPERKLGWDDRLIGAMRTALEADIVPDNLAIGAAAAVRIYAPENPSAAVEKLWQDQQDSVVATIRNLIKKHLEK